MADKLLPYVILLALIGGGGWLFNHQIKARVYAETRATQAELAQELAERERDRMEQALEDEQRRAGILQEELDAARIQFQESTAVLADRERLDRVLQAKPGLLERRAQAATTRVWTEIETEANAPLQ